MALTLSTTDTVRLDETNGLHDDDTASSFPLVFANRLSLLTARTLIEKAISSDAAISISGVTGSITDIGFTDASGVALNGTASGLYTLEGKQVFLYTDTNNNILVGREGNADGTANATGDIVLAVYFDESTNKLWSALYEPLEHPDGAGDDNAVTLNANLTVSTSSEINFQFAGAPSGSNLFMMFGSGATQIVVIGQDPLNQSEGGNISTKDVLNISQAGSTTSFGVNGNQINPDEGAFITYVTGADTNFLVPGLDQNEADVEANIQFANLFNTTGASFTVNQTNPGVGPVTVRITAFTTAKETGTGFVDGLTNDTQVDITAASIVNFVVNKEKQAPTFEIDADGALIVHGLTTGDQVRWTTGANHNRVLIENISDADDVEGNDNNTFDIGGFSLISTTAETETVAVPVHFDDDGPTAAIVQNAAIVAHDETAGLDADADDTTAAAVAALFAGVANVSADLSPTGYAQDAAPVVSSTGSSFGADTLGGTIAFSLDVSAAGVDSGLDTTNNQSIFLFKEGDLVVGRIGDINGAAAFAVAIDSTSGVVSMAQYASLEHPTTGASHDEAVSIADSALRAVVTVRDGDGDPATSFVGIGDAVRFQDDGPTAAIGQTAAVVAHDETAGLDADADDTNAAGVSALFAGVANVSADLSPTGYAQDAAAVVGATGSAYGADEEGGTTAFSLAVSAAGVDSGLDTTGGTGIFLFKEGDLVVGRIGGAGGAAAFAVAIDGASGVVSVAQYASLRHPTTGASHDEAVSITDGALLAVVTVTDGDGDTATASTGIGDAVAFQDDGPSIGPISDGLVDFAAGSTTTKSLHAVVGADDPASYAITSSPASLTIFDGTPFQMTLLRDLSASNSVATYFEDKDGSLTRNAGDLDYFRLTVAGGSYTFDVLRDPPAAEISFGFAGAPSGSNLFMMFGSGSTQIVVIGQDPLNQSEGGNITTKDVLNISQAGSTTSFGVNGNQINPDEGAFITYVTGANANFLVPDLDQNEADVEANIDFQNLFGATSASFTVNQSNPGVGPVTVRITAFTTAKETGEDFVDGLTDDTQVDITSASFVDFVVNKQKQVPVTQLNADGTLTVFGLTTGDQVKWTTSGTHNRVLIENISDADDVEGNDNNTFDIGGFGLIQASPSPDEVLPFTVQITDGDGDTASASFLVGIDGTGAFDNGQVTGVSPFE